MNTATADRAAVSNTWRDAAQLTAMIASGLLAGAMAAIWILDGPLGGSAALYTEYRQATTGPLTATLPPLGGLALLAAAVSALLGRGRSRTLVLAAVVCCGAALAVTVVVHFPLNSEILIWSPAAPPPDWHQVRDHWAVAHSARTLLALAAFVLLTLDGWRGRNPQP